MKLDGTELLEVPMLQLMRLWAELVEAYHDKNKFGGNVAEIYAYRFEAYSPFAHSVESKAAAEELGQIALKASRQLYALLLLFATEYDCVVEVNGNKQWRYLPDTPFYHRAHITIHRKGAK